jgi:O-antigen/teichoic acid export membrane protein
VADGHRRASDPHASDPHASDPHASDPHASDPRGSGSARSDPQTDQRDWRGEPETERYDRNLAELLQELRVSGLGVQVLFGFLLGLPFTIRFTQLGTAQRDLYVADLVLAALATALLVGPVAYHRLVFRQHQKAHVVRVANIMAVCGLITVALAISVAVLLIVSYVVPGVAAAVITAMVCGTFAALWLVVPLIRRERSRQ